MVKISAGSYDLNKWLHGGYEDDVVTVIYGEAASGKTNFCLMAAVSQAKKGNKVIYVDTEGGFSVERVKQLIGKVNGEGKENKKNDIEIPSNLVTLQSGISNRHSRTKGSTINGNVYEKNKIATPDLKPDKIKVSLENINKLLGLDLKEKDIEKLLSLMGYEYKNNIVQIPAWRSDILHEVDIIEDAAIAYGYNKFSPEIPNISTIGEESKEEKFKSKIADLIMGLQINEISTYHLIKNSEAELSNLKEKIEVENSKTEFKILRPNLLIPALRIFSENKDHDYPQRIFEIGTIFINDRNNSTDTGILEKENLLIALSPSNFTEIKQILNYIENSLNIKLEIKESPSHQDLIGGRSASISLNKKQIGYFGEMHPKTLQDWNIKMPISIIEISLDEIMNEIFKHVNI